MEADCFGASVASLHRSVNSREAINRLLDD